VNALTSNGELAGKDSPPGADDNGQQRPPSPDSPKVEHADGGEPSQSELVLLNDFGGIACSSIPVRMNTCDIVLFSSKHALSYATKLLTHSKVKVSFNSSFFFFFFFQSDL